MAKSSGDTPVSAEFNGRTIVTIGGGRAKVGGGGYSKGSSKNSSSLKSFEQLEDGDVAEVPGLWPKGYLAAREVSARGPAGRALSAMSDEIPLDCIGVKCDVRWSDGREV